MQCSKCGKTAVIAQQYSGLRLCRRHFIADFETKAKRAIRTHGGLVRGDHIAVVLSGRGTECALLQFLGTLTGNRQDVRLSGIIVDDAVFPDHDLHPARAFAAASGAECIRASFSVEFGILQDDLSSKRDDPDSPAKILMPLLLHRVARRHGITKLAFCTSLEDEAGTVLEQVLLGTPDRLFRMPGIPAGQIADIRPFMYAPFEEVRLYTRLTMGREDPEWCPAPPFVLATEAWAFLHDYSTRHPSAPYSLVSFGEQLKGTGMPVQDDIRFCERCGEPYRDTCRTCNILSGVRCRVR